MKTNCASSLVRWLLRWLCTSSSYTSASWGIERPSYMWQNTERFPFPLPELPEQREALRELTKLHRSLEADFKKRASSKANGESNRESKRFDELVYAYYGVEFGSARLSKTPSTCGYQARRRTDHQRYQPWIQLPPPTGKNTWHCCWEARNTWRRRGGKKISGRIINSPATALAVVRLSRDGVMNAVEKEAHHPRNLIAPSGG